MRKPIIAAFAVVTAATLTLAGCGTTEDTAEPTSGAGAISVVDSRGETVSVDAPATKVVALEWNSAESLVALGVMPTGVADVTNYALYVGETPLDDSVTDVGVRGEPSVDAIAGLAPDLVVADNSLSESVIAQIEEIAPVLVLRGADTTNAIGQMEDNLTSIATLTGSEDAAETLIAGVDAKIAEGKAALEEAGFAGTEFALSDAYFYNGEVTIRPYYKGALLSDVTEELGLVNGWDGEGDADYGLGSTDVEGLTTLGDVNYLYLGSPDGNVYTDQLADNAIWTSLPFVESGKTYEIAPGIWPFGGPASVSAYVDAVVDALTA